MKILVLNCGSSSVKYKLFNMDTHEVLAQGGVEKLGLPGSFLKFTQPDGKKVILEKEMPEHNAAIEFILSVLTDDKYGCIKSFNEIDAVGHRVVHGGEAFSSSVEITPEVIGKMVECIDLAPLHNPPNLKGIRAMSALSRESVRWVCSTLLSIRQCRIMLICTVCLILCIRNMVSVVMVSTEPVIAMYQNVLAISWVSLTKNSVSLQLT